MASPAELRYTKTHEWVRRDGDVVTIGITDHAQSELGDITYLELPEIGATVATNEPFGIVESVKAASDVYAPVEGEVIERNEEAIAAPDLINSSPYDRAWLVKLRVANPEQVEQLMAPADYDVYAEATGH
ncbi:MAG TPA: glycine cleavage system protein GcvH [Thermomicrobiales bacterium]|nr:glycine cleavage system protein GcvH [Thermomicrobiales bacterium]